MLLLKKLIMMIFLVSIISCSSIVKPPKLPVPSSPILTNLSPEELQAFKDCSDICKQGLKKINKNYQSLLSYSKKLKAVIESQ